ncbi:MAG: hypothetical protein COA42_14755 [Alteromonadaceae bacterium]|nr:MAG: hypothetical protein COA42_14755 [Alteromonadaceae bacterium]
MIPKHSDLRQLGLRCVIATAPGTDYDFVTRVFAPKFGIPEDPVTGSAYTQLMPYWAERLGKTKLKAKQISARGGEVFCELKGDRVMIAGYAHYYMEGTVFI